MGKKKRELRGIKINYPSGWPVYFEGIQFERMTVDCHLGSLIITKNELLDYLEKRKEQSHDSIRS